MIAIVFCSFGKMHDERTVAFSQNYCKRGIVALIESRKDNVQLSNEKHDSQQ